MHAPIHNKRARINTTVGQYNSQLVYCSYSFFLQHLEGHFSGQIQQQRKQGDMKIIKTNPKMNGPINAAAWTTLD